MGKSAALTLCSVAGAGAGAGLKYICFNVSKNNLGRTHTRHSGSKIWEEEKTFSEIPLHQPKELARLYRPWSSLIGYEWHHPQGQSSSQSDDVISAEASQWCNAGEGHDRLISSTPPPRPLFSSQCLFHFPPAISPLPFPLHLFRNTIFCSSAAPRLKSLPTCLLALTYRAHKAIKDETKWQKESIYIS